MSENKRKRMKVYYEPRFKPLKKLPRHNQPTMSFNPILQQPIIINPVVTHGEQLGEAVQILMELKGVLPTNQNSQSNLMYITLPPGLNQVQNVIQEILTRLLGPQANLSFVTEVEKVNPEKEEELDPDPEVDPLQPMGTSADAMKWKKQFKCAFPGCMVKFASLYEQKIHAGTHMPAASTKFKCNICGLLFDRATNRNKHVDSHNVVHTYKCKMCKKSFPYYTSLAKHINEEKCAAIKSFSCNFCGVQIVDADDLEKHQKVDMKLCPCRAKICGTQAFKLHTSLCIVYKQIMGKSNEGSCKKKLVSMLLS